MNRGAVVALPFFSPEDEGDEITEDPHGQDRAERRPPAGTRGAGEGTAPGHDPLAAPPRVATLSDELAATRLDEHKNGRTGVSAQKKDEGGPSSRSLHPAPALKGMNWLYTWKALDHRTIAEKLKPGMFVKVWVEPQPVVPKLKDAAAGVFLVRGWSAIPDGGPDVHAHFIGTPNAFLRPHAAKAPLVMRRMASGEG